MSLSLATLAACGGGRSDEGMRFRGSDVDCLARAMYFESIRSSRDGMIAVGSVVMNRVESDDFPDTVCGVVGQRGQFAPGVLSRSMSSQAAPLARESATAVLRGERHPLVGASRFFHAATYHAGYNNMHYTVTAGGNAFYEKRDPSRVTRPNPMPPVEGLTGG